MSGHIEESGHGGFLTWGWGGETHQGLIEEAAFELVLKAGQEQSRGLRFLPGERACQLYLGSGVG